MSETSGKLLRSIDRFYQFGAKARFDSLDGLRGVAALMVFFVHFMSRYDNKQFLQGKCRIVLFAVKYLHSGQIGVDLFFVLSGFLIARVMYIKRPKFLNFMSQRMKRLLPAHIAILIFYLLFITSKVGLLDIIANVLFVDRLFSGIVSINVVTWSLNYELLFYIGIGIASVLVCKFEKLESIFLFLLIALLVWSSNLWLKELLEMNNHNVSVLPNPYRMMGFFWGMGLAKLHLNSAAWEKMKPFFRHGIFLAILSAMVLQWFFEWGRQNQPIYFLMVNLDMFVIVGYLLDGQSWLHKFFTNKPLRIIGTICYSFYLSHTLCIKIVSKMIQLPKTVSGMFLELAGTLAFVVLFSSVVYFFFERPYFSHRKIKLSPK